MARFYEEFQKYHIPVDDIDLLDWLINGDEASTKEGWEFYIRCIFSSVEFARTGAPLKNIFYQMKGKRCTTFDEDEERCLDYEGNYLTYPAVGMSKFLPCEKELLSFINDRDVSLMVSVRDFAKKYTVPSVSEFYVYENEFLREHYPSINSRNLANLHAINATKMILDAIAPVYNERQQFVNAISQEKDKILEKQGHIDYLLTLNVDTPDPVLRDVFKFYCINQFTKRGRRNRVSILVKSLEGLISQSADEIDELQRKIDEFPIYKKISEKLDSLLEDARKKREMTRKDMEASFENIYIRSDVAAAEVLLKEPYLLSMVEMMRTRSDFKYEDYLSIYLRLHDAVVYGDADLPQQSVEEFVSEVRSNAYIFQNLFSDDILFETDLEKISERIRRLMIESNLTSEMALMTSYRNIKIGDNGGYISGAHLGREEISLEMKKLAERFNSVQQIEDIEEYVKGCADIFHDYIRLHPYADGNGRCSRMLLQVMLAKRGIYVPSLYDTHYDCLRKYKKGNFRYCCDQALKTKDNQDIVAYICDRVNKFYPQLFSQSVLEDDVILADTSVYNFQEGEHSIKNGVYYGYQIDGPFDNKVDGYDGKCRRR